MPKTKGTLEEDILLLYPEIHSEKFNRFPQQHPGAPIIKGVVTQLRKWPSDLFCAFLAACLIIASLIFLIFLTLAVCLPAAIDNRMPENLEIEDAPNVYFLKLENQTWSTREFCYIETAARQHPDLNVYLINLLSDETGEGSSHSDVENEGTARSLREGSVTNTSNSVKLTPEDHLKKQLVSANENIRNINVSIERLFKGSKLSRVAKNLNGGLLEMAAKAQLLWNSPGIVLSPSMYCNLGTMEQFICNRKKQDCLPDKFATIELSSDIQAVGVPCQAFVGFLIQEISKNGRKGKYTIRDAVEEYCPRIYYCPEIRIVDLNPKCSTAELDCPIVYSSTVLLDDLNLENYVT